MPGSGIACHGFFCVLWKRRGEKGEGRREKGEGEGEGEGEYEEEEEAEGRSEKGEGRREKGEGRREKGEGESAHRLRGESPESALRILGSRGPGGPMESVPAASLYMCYIS